MRANERLVKFFDLKVSAYAGARGTAPFDVPARPIADLLRKLKAHLAATPYTRQNRSRTEAWHIADIQFNDTSTAAFVLISRSDRLAADQAISDPHTQHFGIAEKTGDQGNASSAHLVIKLHPIANSTYLTLLEESTGIGSADVAMLLGLVSKACAKASREFFMCNDPSGDAAIRHFSTYKFTFRGHPSTQLQDEINEGKLRGIELVEVSPGPVQFDGIVATVEKKKVTHLTVKNAPQPMFDMLKKIGQSAKRMHVPSLRVQFEDTNQFVRTVEIDAATMTLINEDRYVQKVRITNLSSRLATGSKAVQPELAARMSALL